MKKRTCALIVSLAALLPSGLYAGESRANRTGRPNILFAVADDWSFGHAGVYGCKWVKTPAMDRVAHNGLLFTRAYTPDGKCAPSRACMLTGRNPWQLKAAANHWSYFPSEFKTFPEALEGLGYTTGMTGKGWGPGVAKDADGNERQMTGHPFNKRQMAPPTAQISSKNYAANFADFLAAAPKDVPWCFWYGGHEPHREYEFGSGVAKGGKKLSEIDRVPACWPDNAAVRNDMLDYAYEAEYFDMHLGRMLDELEKRGLLENTLVIVTSDNGMPFPHDKGHAYNDSDHIPLAIMWKNGIPKPGRVVADYVSLIDLAPTLVEVAGLAWETTGMAKAEGQSLVDILMTESSPRPGLRRDHVLIGKERNDVGRPNDWGYPIRGIIKNDRLYLHNFEPSRWPGGNPESGYTETDGSPTKTQVLQSRRDPGKKYFWELSFGKRPSDELYDLKKDPDCILNLAHTLPFDQLKAQLFDELKKQGDPRLNDNASIFDSYPCSNPDDINFYARLKKGEKVKAGWVNNSDFENLDGDEK